MKLASVILTISFLFLFCMPTFAGNISMQRAATTGTLINLVFEKTPKSVSISSRSLTAQPSGVCEISQISITSKNPVDRIEILFDGKMAQGGIGRDAFFPEDWVIEGYGQKIIAFGPANILNGILLFAFIGKTNFSTPTPWVEINVRKQEISTIFSIIGEKTSSSVAFELRTTPPTNAISGWGGNFFITTTFEWWQIPGQMLIKVSNGWPADQIMGAPPRDPLLSINKGEHLFVPTKTSTTWGKIKAVGQ